MKYLIVTSWSEEGGKLYGEKWLDGFKKHWPGDCGAFVVTDEMIHADPVAADFFRRHADKRIDSTKQGYNYRMDLVRFAHKIFALKIGLREAIKADVQWLVWLDGDVVTHTSIPDGEMAKWMPDNKDVAYLSRAQSWDHPECGFFGINLARPQAKAFLETLIDQWALDKVLGYHEYHDSHIFGVLLANRRLDVMDLCPRSNGLDAFGPSVLGKYMDHRKGGRKVEYRKVSGGTPSAEQITNGAFGGNIVLKTRNCRPEGEIRDNIKANLGIIDKWLMPAQSHQTPLVLISAGESLKDKIWLDEIRRRQDAGASVWCVKHSLQTLLDNGIVPWACVLLDPRPHTGSSTHGFPREVMMQNVGSAIKVFAASMVDPSVTRALKERGADLWGWHAAVGADERSVIPKDHPLVPGGSTSIMRAISLGWMLGYRFMDTYAMDSCHFHPEKLDLTLKNPDGTPKYFEITATVGDESRSFLTDRDLLAQCQDYAKVRKENPMLELRAKGPGMVPFVDKAGRDNHKSFEEVYGFAPA